MKKLKQLITVIVATLSIFGASFMPALAAYADEDENENTLTTTTGMSVSPMSTKIVLLPGEQYTSSIKVYNVSDATSGAVLNYRVFVDSFFVDDDYTVTLGTANDFNAMKDWIVLGDNAEGSIEAGSYAEIPYTISVPESAPAGGQYASIVAASVPGKNTEGTVGVQEIWQIASTIYASVSGSSTLTGNIESNSVPSIVFSNPLQSSATVKNTGNVHANATSYLQVYPLFSNEEVYTNEEDPNTMLVLPGTTRYLTNTWEGAPALGIFRVVQTVEAFGGSSVTEKIVLICPLWFLIIVGVLLAVCIFWLVSRAIRRKKKSNND